MVAMSGMQEQYPDADDGGGGEGQQKAEGGVQNGSDGWQKDGYGQRGSGNQEQTEQDDDEDSDSDSDDDWTFCKACSYKPSTRNVSLP